MLSEEPSKNLATTGLEHGSAVFTHPQKLTLTEIEEKDNQHVSRKLNIDFAQTTSPSLKINAVPIKPVIFASASEQEFYNTLVHSKLDHSPRISEINKIWVDKKNLALSMSQGGWIHPFVMDSYGNLMNTIQHDRVQEGTFEKKDIIRYIVIKEDTKILMDPRLNHSDPNLNYFFSPKNVGGMRLDQAGLVLIPCPFDRQWLLIVSNFIDLSFDVLNSDKAVDKFNTLINTVTNNFKFLFDKSYPHARYFDIKKFGLRTSI